jgi:dipeptidase E
MKLYLSSYHLGNRAQELGSLFTNKKVALISNALDFVTDLERKKQSAERELSDLRSVGLDPEEIDLREYFGKKEILAEKMTEFGGVWVRGGNSFVLRKAMEYSGFGELLQIYKKDQNFVYSGFSAGVCMLAPSLRGIELVDNPDEVPEGYQKENIWQCFNIIPYNVAPHYKSDHPESERMEETIQYYIDHKMLFLALRDGDDIIDEV